MIREYNIEELRDMTFDELEMLYTDVEYEFAKFQDIAKKVLAEKEI